MLTCPLLIVVRGRSHGVTACLSRGHAKEISIMATFETVIPMY